MTFDRYAFLDKNTPPERVNEAGLVSAPEDEYVVAFLKAELERAQAEEKEKKAHKESDKKKKKGSKKEEAVKRKNKARQDYMQQAADQERKYSLLSDFRLEPVHAFLPDPDWFAIDVSFTLESPWYSKDDRPLHVLVNPVRKDRVFGVPFMSAASWKGLLRWACRRRAGLPDRPKKHGTRMEGWKDPPWILHLFGNERGEDERFRSGALVCHPTWFDKVSFEVINSYYEVVPVGTEGKLRLLYAPLPGESERDQTTPDAFISDFINSIRALLENYGISAKRTAGWGKARIDAWTGILAASRESPETHPEKGTDHSTQDFDTPEWVQSTPEPFTFKDTEEFKVEMKKRIARRGGNP